MTLLPFKVLSINLNIPEVCLSFNILNNMTILFNKNKTERSQLKRMITFEISNGQQKNKMGYLKHTTK